MSLKYRESVITHLMNHGIKPDENTPPTLVREFINDLYLYEIRVLRKSLLDGLIPKSEYANHVLELRNRYPLLSLPLQFWTEVESVFSEPTEAVDNLTDAEFMQRSKPGN